jgi:hypothetical protein
VIEVLGKVGRYAFPIGIRHILGDVLESCGETYGDDGEPMRIVLLFLDKFQTLADNFIGGPLASAADLFCDQALNVRA